jgi:hypothetical protein
MGRVDGDALAGAIDDIANSSAATAEKGSHDVVAPLRAIANDFRTLTGAEGMPTRVASNLRTRMRDTLDMHNPTVLQAYKATSQHLERAIGEISPEMLSAYRVANSEYGPLAQLHSLMSRPRLNEVLGRSGGGLGEMAERGVGAVVGGTSGAIVAPTVIGAIKSVSSIVHRNVLRGVSNMLRSDPERLGQAARPLQAAIERGGMQAFQAEHHRQMQSDAQYRQMVEQMEQESENQEDSPEADQLDLDAMMEETF